MASNAGALLPRGGLSLPAVAVHKHQTDQYSEGTALRGLALTHIE